MCTLFSVACLKIVIWNNQYHRLTIKSEEFLILILNQNIPSLIKIK